MKMSVSQIQFLEWLKQMAPELIDLWDWENREIDPAVVKNYLGTASHGQAIMCRFAVAIWYGQNKFNFDIVDAAGALDPIQRQAIAEWLIDPFWP